MPKKSWFRFENVADDPSAIDIYVVDIIGGWIDEWLWPGGGPGVVTAKAFIQQLAELPATVKTIRLHVNSPGGDVFAAVTIANALRDQRLTKGRTVDVFVDGLAASAASIIIMAGNTIQMGDNALLMVHNPWTMAVGSAADMRKSASDLDIVRDTIVTTYQWQSRLEPDAIVALLDAETWMDADEAIANGFATGKLEGLKAAALLDPRGLSRLHVPDKFRARLEALQGPAPQPAEAPTPAPAADVLGLCREADCLALAEDLVRDGATLEQAQARITAAVSARDQTAACERDIRAACALAHFAPLADQYVAGGMTLEAVRAQLTTLTAMADRIPIDGSLVPGQGATPKARINTADIYAKRNHSTKEQ